MDAETTAAARRDGPVSLALRPEGVRFNLRIAPGDLGAASAAFGLALPGRIGAAAGEGGRRALCLGPDEWVLWAEAGAGVAAAFAGIAAQTPHSLVEISDREIGLGIEGAEAAVLLSIGCPADVEAMAVGTGARTVFDGVQVVLCREAPERYTLEVWRSFLPHVRGLLETGNRELAAQA